MRRRIEVCYIDSFTIQSKNIMSFMMNSKCHEKLRTWFKDVIEV